MSRKELDGTFGMYEMEEAVEIMLVASEKENIPFNELGLFPHNFTGSELIGICHLIYRQLLAPFYPNSYFVVTQKLVDHMKGFYPWKETWKDMEPVPTFEQRSFAYLGKES